MVWAVPGKASSELGAPYALQRCYRQLEIRGSSSWRPQITNYSLVVKHYRDTMKHNQNTPRHKSAPNPYRQGQGRAKHNQSSTKGPGHCAESARRPHRMGGISPQIPLSTTLPQTAQPTDPTFCFSNVPLACALPLHFSHSDKTKTITKFAATGLRLNHEIRPLEFTFISLHSESLVSFSIVI